MEQSPGDESGPEAGVRSEAPRRDAEFEADRTRLIARLTDDGVSPERAVELVDAWEAEAVERRLPLGSPEYWEQAPAWIGETLDAGLEIPMGLSQVVAWALIGSVLFGIFVLQFTIAMLQAALGISEGPAFVLGLLIVGGLLAVVARRSGAWAGIRGLPGRYGWSRIRPWALVPLSFGPIVVLALVGLSPLPGDVKMVAITLAMIAMAISIGGGLIWAVFGRRDL